MAYIGKEPIVGNFQKCDAITVVNGQAAYTLQVSSTNVVPESANHMLVSLNGILQAPVTSFTVSGSTLTFASNLATGDVIDFVILLGNVLDLGTPSDNTVTTAKIADDAVTSSRIQATTTYFTEATWEMMPVSIIYLDSPSSTSALTYKVQGRTAGSGNTLYLNRSALDSDSDSYYRAGSSITLMEIGA